MKGPKQATRSLLVEGLSTCNSWRSKTGGGGVEEARKVRLPAEGVVVGAGCPSVGLGVQASAADDTEVTAGGNRRWTGVGWRRQVQVRWTEESKNGGDGSASRD